MSERFTAYAITEGGPLRRLERALRITRGDRYDWERRALFVLAIAYVPLLLIGLGWRLYAGHWIPGLLHLDVHGRVLLAIPLLLVAEPFVEARARGAGRYLFESDVVSPAAERYRAAIARTERLRDSRLAEAAILALAVVLAFDVRTYSGGVAAFHWGSLPGIVAFRFLLLRWLWRWLVWGIFLLRLSRLRLALRSTHPDRMAGLEPLVGPSYAFTAVVAAISTALAAGWGDRMLHEGVGTAPFHGAALAFFLVMSVVAMLPVCSFMPRLYEARRGGMEGYGAFTHRFVIAFEKKWFGAPGAAGLGVPDISSLCDLGQSFEVVGEIRMLTWARRLILLVVISAIVPMLPLVIADVGLPEIIKRLGDEIL